MKYLLYFVIYIFEKNELLCIWTLVTSVHVSFRLFVCVALMPSLNAITDWEQTCALHATASSVQQKDNVCSGFMYIFNVILYHILEVIPVFSFPAPLAFRYKCGPGSRFPLE